MNFINRNQLKLAMMFLMVLDHIQPFVSPEVAALFHVLTRCVGVFFAYMCVEGIRYTTNQEKYLARLWLAGVGMQLGNVLLNRFVFAEAYQVHNNIFLTLAIGTSILYFIQYFSETASLRSKLLYGTAIFFLAVIALLTEGGFILIPFMLICYLGVANIRRRNGCLLLFSLVLLLLNFVNYGNLSDTLLMLVYNSDFLLITVVPILAVYNGKKGSSRPAVKYLFYFFYPVHLYVIAGLATLLYS